MTTIAWDGRTLAGDRLVVQGTAVFGQARKVHRLPDGRLLGVAGPLAAFGAVMLWLRDGGDRPKDWPEQMEVIEVLPSGHVRSHEAMGVIAMERGPQVLGSGGKFALAAMALGKTAEEAVRLAARLDTCTGSRIDVLALREVAR